jgi:hypothetical protein
VTSALFPVENGCDSSARENILEVDCRNTGTCSPLPFVCLLVCLLACLFVLSVNHSRQRNRLHAKTTRDRKKSMVSTMEQLVLELQVQKRQMLTVLVQVAQHSTNAHLPLPSPSSLLSTTRTTSGQEEDEKDHLTMNVLGNETCSVVSI